MNLSLYDDSKYKLAVSRLSAHVNNKDIFRLEKRNTGIGIKVCGDLSKKCIVILIIKIVFLIQQFVKVLVSQAQNSLVQFLRTVILKMLIYILVILKMFLLKEISQRN